MRASVLPWFAFALFVGTAAAPAFAATAYKCVAADGGLSFQDHPCANGARQQRLHLQEDAAPTPTWSDTAAEEAPAPTEAPRATVQSAPRVPPPDFFLCMRYDGSRYLSETGIGSRTAVPYGMLGGSGQGLAEAYGGPNGIGVSAPGLRKIPNIPAAQTPLAGAYVWVDDECHHAGAQEACTYLRGELDGIQDKLKRAFSDTEAQLKQDAQRLRERMRGC